MSHVSIANTTPANTADAYAQNTRAGVMAYAAGTNYNGGVSPTITSTLDGYISEGSFIPYQNQSGGWRLRGNIVSRSVGVINNNIGVGSGGVNISVYQVKQQTDGKILIGGAFNSWAGTSGRNKLVRLNADGSIDSTFQTNIGTAAGTTAGQTVQTILIQSSGKIVVVGSFTTWNGASRPRGIIRLNADGTEDTTFNTNVAAAITAFAGNKRAVLASGDKIILHDNNSGPSINIGGTFYSFIKLNSDGTIDSSFFKGTCVSGFSAAITSLSVDSSDNIYVGGDLTGVITAAGTFSVNTSGDPYVGIAKLTPTNSAGDTTFRTNWSASFTVAALDYNNSPEIGQSFVDSATSRLFFSAQSAGGYFVINLNGAQIQAYSSVNMNLDGSTIKQSDGKYVLFGNFTSFNGSSRNRIARLNSDLTIDTTFTTNTGTAANQVIYDVADVKYQSGLLLGGFFTSFNGTSKTGVIKLLTTGVTQSIASSTTNSDAITGVTFSTAGNQAVTTTVGAAQTFFSETVANTSNITTTSGSSLTALGSSFDVALASKPTWAY